jgi:hypothetical protein
VSRAAKEERRAASVAQAHKAIAALTHTRKTPPVLLLGL